MNPKPLEASYTHTHLRRVRDLGRRVFGEANPILLSPFLFGHYLQNYFEKEVKMTFINVDKADLDSPRRELSNGGLGIVVTLLVPW